MAAEKQTTTKIIASVAKAMDVLDLIAQSEDGLSVTEISAALNTGVSATYHLLNTLKLDRVIEQDKRTKKYRIGFTIFRICNMARNQNLLGGLTNSYLERLQQQVGETSNMAILEGSEVVCIAQSESSRLLRMFSQLGSRSPYYYTAGGKALVSYLPKPQRDKILQQTEFKKFTENTICSVESLLQEFDLIHSRGYSLDNEEREEGVICIAAPLFDSFGDAIAAISISGPSYRLREKGVHTIGQIVKETATDLSIDLGYQPPTTAVHDLSQTGSKG